MNKVEKIETVESFSHYASLASRTNVDLGYKLNMSHMVMGMMSELSEYVDALRSRDVVNQKEELCDILWYVVNCCNISRIDADLVYKGVNKRMYPKRDCFDLHVVNNIAYHISQFSDLIKKHVVYDKPLNIGMEHHFLCNVVSSVVSLFSDEKDLFKSLANNINKLIVRFPDKFTTENALNRMLDKERVELERE